MLILSIVAELKQRIWIGIQRVVSEKNVSDLDTMFHYLPVFVFVAKLK